MAKLERKWDAAATVLLGCLASACYFPELLGKRSFFFFDVSTLNIPARDWGFRQIAVGEFPQWCPHWGCGFPYVAESQAGVCYPLNYLFFLTLPSWYATTFAYVFHLWLAGVGAYFLYRRWATPAGAFLAALSFELGGRLLEHQIHPAVMEVIAWFPWTLLLLHEAASARNRRALLLAGLVGGVQLLAGSLQMTICCHFGCIALLAVLGAALRRPGRASAVYLGFAGVTLGISAVLWLPAAELLFLSERASGAAAWAAYGTVAPIRWLCFVAPTLFGHPGFATAWLSLDEPAYEMGLYHGVLAVPLAIVGFLSRRAGYGVPLFTMLVLAGLTLSAGELHLLGTVLRRLPVLGSIRAPARFLALTGVGTCGLLAIGWDELRLAPAAARRTLCWATALALTAVGAAVLYLYLPIFWLPNSDADAMKWTEIVRSGFPAKLRDMAAAELPRPAAALFGGLLAAWGAARAPCLSLAIAVACIVVDVGRHARGWYPTIEPSFHDEPAAARFIRSRFVPPRVFVHWGQNLLRKVDVGQQGYRYTLAPWRQIGECLYYERGPLFDVGLLGDDGRLPLQTRRMAEFRGRLGDDPRFLPLQAVQAEMWPTQPPPGAAVVFRGKECSLTEVAAAPPFAYMCKNVEYVKPGAALDRLVEEKASPNPPQPRDRVLIESDDDEPPVGDGRFVAARAEWHGPNRFRVSVSAPMDGVLVVNETWHPGWSATLNGKSLPLLRANHLFMAVRVAAGEQTIEFQFVSRPVLLGACLGLFTLAAWCAAFWFAPHRQMDLEPLAGASGRMTAALIVLFVASFLVSAAVFAERWRTAFPTLLGSW